MEEFLQKLTMEVIGDYKRKAEQGGDYEEDGLCEMILEMKGMKGEETNKKKKETVKRQKKQRIMNVAVEEVIKEQKNEFSQIIPEGNLDIGECMIPSANQLTGLLCDDIN